MRRGNVYMAGEGTLTWEDFVHGIRHILTVSELINDGWTCRGNLEEWNGAYVAKQIHYRLPSSAAASIASNSLDEKLHEQDFEEEDPGCCTILNPTDEVTVFKELHLLYNPAFGVPTLYLRAWKLDGSSFPFDSLWKDFLNIQQQHLPPDDSQSPFDPLRTLTQQEHPFLGEPWYCLHPCQTANLMQHIAGDGDKVDDDNKRGERYMIAWMSTIVPLLGCSVSPSYAVRSATPRATGSGST